MKWRALPLAALAVAGCATGPRLTPEGVARAWSGFDAPGYDLPQGTTVTSVSGLTCRPATDRRDLGRELRRAYWCDFTLHYRQPDGREGAKPIDRWLVGETERRAMAVAR